VIPIGKVWPTVWTRRPMAHSSAMLPRKPAAVVFDMDGLLFDTETLSQKAIVLAAAEGGHDVAPDVFTRTIGLPWAPCRALLLSHFGESFPVDQFQEAWTRHLLRIQMLRQHHGTLLVNPGSVGFTRSGRF